MPDPVFPWVPPALCAALAVALLSSAQAEGGSPADLVFVCRRSNDLYATLTSGGRAYPRYASAEEAVRNAPAGAGVLILADGYPGRTTPVSCGLLDEAARRALRVYVEYPSELPNMVVGEPRFLRTGEYGAIVERTVVAGRLFEPDLAPMRILAIHDCHVLPTQATDAHLVLARVEGYDTAVYGLPAETTPVLFEHPRGGLLVATTKLSQFVTARYGPTEAWSPVWQGILAWLQPGSEVPELRWTPAVHPTYGPTEALPSRAQRDAVKRAVGWYQRSRLLMHPEWPEEVHPGVDGLRRDAPVGDGSHGFAEGYIGKRIFVDGTQAVSRSVRADCNLEAAMGLAFGADLGDREAADTARRLNDLILVGSPVSQGPRADPTSPSYGLLAWSDQAGSTYWGDDNARGVLSAIASSALLESDRWDEAICRTILANYRTTGPKGFRPANIDEGTLQQAGWRHFWTLDHIDFCPHMQSWPWATYLWLYDKTGYGPLLERARTGIRLMMAAYPNWRLEANRFEQERARMLLPLAWLVRADDTPEHRAWLRTVAGYVIGIQDESGAIPQRVGHVVGSNEAYGTGECALIHQDGDPATDLLYTTNFAFIGMHEAAEATGDPDYSRAAARLADFLVRIQTSSESHPELDGTWYRSFDFRKWDYWGSDGDAGWGVWTIESGWTHSWITATLALRQRGTSLWELTEKSRIGKAFGRLRPVMLPEDAL